MRFFVAPVLLNKKKTENSGILISLSWPFTIQNNLEIRYILSIDSGGAKIT